MHNEILSLENLLVREVYQTNQVMADSNTIPTTNFPLYYWNLQQHRGRGENLVRDPWTGPRHSAPSMDCTD